MSVEQEIMCAVARIDMFLMTAWKVTLIALLLFMIALLIMLRRK